MSVAFWRKYDIKCTGCLTCSQAVELVGAADHDHDLCPFIVRCAAVVAEGRPADRTPVAVRLLSEGL
jgi:hypothetical protein